MARKKIWFILFQPTPQNSSLWEEYWNLEFVQGETHWKTFVSVHGWNEENWQERNIFGKHVVGVASNTNDESDKLTDKDFFRSQKKKQKGGRAEAEQQ